MTNQVNLSSQKIKKLKSEIKKIIVGQEKLIEMLIIGLLSEGHILLEGVPGLAKTLTISTLSKTLDLGFSRVQFTPDLLPSDLVGTEIYNSKTGNFEIKKGPIFNNFILADEINRAPSKVHSALLEAMSEKQITIGKDIFPLEEPFLVLATQNPIEQSGTYNLPEAQLDRIMLKITVSYPKKEDERDMYKNMISNNTENLDTSFTKQEILNLQKIVKEIFVSDSIFDYVMNLVDASRNPENYDLGEIKKYIHFGISPRGGLAILSAAKAKAFLEGREFVIPEDIKHLAKEAFSHRIILSYEALADEIDADYIVEKILENVEVV